MKELSIEEKARRYDEAIEKANELNYVSDKDSLQRKTVEHIFPELKESEDEKIRCTLINHFKTQVDLNRTWNGLKNTDILAWLEKQDNLMRCLHVANSKISDLIEENYYLRENLEKQGELKSINNLTQQEAMDIAVAKCFEQGEQKPASKVEPKFKVGNWIVYNNSGGVCQVTEIRDDEYCLWPLDAEIMGYLRIIDVDNDYHLYTIQDAKDGSVLCCESGWTCIFKTLNSDNMSFSSYCFIDNTGWFCETGSEAHTLEKAFIKAYNGNIYPATKEQRDLLFQKMKEAGYEWDAEHKQLKKIEHKSAEWSKEDEKRISSILLSIEYCKEQYPNLREYQYDIDWLKSLKERIVPQTKQEWKQENTGDLTDFENAMMHIGGSFFGNNAGLDPNDTNAIKEQANILLELVSSKKWSEEDIRKIDELIALCKGRKKLCSPTVPAYKRMDELKEWLKSLRPQNRWNDISVPPKFPCDILFKYPNGNKFIFRYMENGRKNSAETPMFSSLEEGEWIYLDDIEPQSHWKPSDEQMAVLNEVINYAANSELQHWSNFIYTLLKSLREQLKKLREE